MTARLIDPDQPRYLDRYELIAELASGGMATVYLARLAGIAGFQRLVAIKHLHPHLEHDQQFVQMFLDEARLAAGIHHPHVVPILEVGASASGHYLVMEYVEGDTLARLLARAISSPDGAFPMSVAVRVMIHTLEGLHAAHELTDDFGRPLDLVHRDVSPQNILVGVDGVARITDFGVARALSRLTSTQAGQLKGKLAYMAPEQARGTSLDRRTDVFAAGIVLWEALCMRRLFRGETDAETLNRVLYEPIPEAVAYNPSVPEGVNAVIRRALAREPGQRFATCLDFAEALESEATKAGTIASVRDVATFVQSLMGQEIAAQRDKVRAWLSRSEPSQAWPPPPSGVRVSRLHTPPVSPTSLSTASMSVAAARGAAGQPAPLVPGSKAHRSILVAAALLSVAVVVSVGFVLASRWRQPTASPVSAPVPAASPLSAVSVAGQVSASASATAASPPSDSAAASAAYTTGSSGTPRPGTRASAGVPRTGAKGGGAGKESDDDLAINPYR